MEENGSACYKAGPTSPRIHTPEGRDSGEFWQSVYKYSSSWVPVSRITQRQVFYIGSQRPQWGQAPVSHNGKVIENTFPLCFLFFSASPPQPPAGAGHLLNKLSTLSQSWSQPLRKLQSGPAVRRAHILPSRTHSGSSHLLCLPITLL